MRQRVYRCRLGRGRRVGSMRRRAQRRLEVFPVLGSYGEAAGEGEGDYGVRNPKPD
jgi:hypothetical protein